MNSIPAKPKQIKPLQCPLNRISNASPGRRSSSGSPVFDANTAWAVGTRIRAVAAARGLSVAIDIRVNGHLLFFDRHAGHHSQQH